jgi:hypothetical protein
MRELGQMADLWMSGLWGPGTVEIVLAGSVCGFLASKPKSFLRAAAIGAAAYVFLILIFPLDVQNLVVIPLIFF